MRKIQLLISVAVIGSGSYLPSITWAEGLANPPLSTDSSSEELTTDKDKVAEPATEVAEISSEWDTSWEKLYLNQQGTKITGKYRVIHTNGQIIGILEGRLLKGWWRNTGSCGPGKAWNGSLSFLFAEDGQSFVGDAGGCSKTPENLNPNHDSWNGTIAKGVLNFSETSHVVDESPAMVPKEKANDESSTSISSEEKTTYEAKTAEKSTDVAEVSSEWNTTWNKIYMKLFLNQHTNIMGNYKFSSVPGQLIGTLEGRLLKGWWRNNSSCGPGKAWNGWLSFLFAEDGQSFVGEVGGCSKTPEKMSWNGTIVKGLLNISETSHVVDESPAMVPEEKANDESSAPAANLRETNVGGE